MTQQPPRRIHVGVLALQGAFSEHIQLLKKAFAIHEARGNHKTHWSCGEIRTPQELKACDALIIPGGESTAIALVAERSGMLDPLRDFVKVDRRPTWGTCAGLILLAEAANRTKKGGQDLIGGIDVRVNRNHFGRQVESFERDIHLPFLKSEDATQGPFKGVFIRAPVVEKILSWKEGIQDEEELKQDTVVAPSRNPKEPDGLRRAEVEIMAKLPGRGEMAERSVGLKITNDGNIVAVRQKNVFGTSFHPELTTDPRIHLWWLEEISNSLSAEVSDRASS